MLQIVPVLPTILLVRVEIAGVRSAVLHVVAEIAPVGANVLPDRIDPGLVPRLLGV